MSKQFTALILGLILAAICLPLAAQTYSFQPFSYPNAVSTFAHGINNRGAVVGHVEYSYKNFFSPFGFKRDANGVLERPFDAPLATPPDTVATGITDHGLIVGYTDTGQTTGQVITAGFLLYHGVFTYYNAQPGWDTSITGINNKGDFVGQTDHFSGNGKYDGYGFINSNGVVTKIQCPNSSNSTRTIPQGIAADGTVVGSCEYGSGAVALGFVRGPAGRYKIIQIPNAQVFVYGINNLAHKVVGTYYDLSTGRRHGFVYDYITDITATVDYPGVFNTEITGINSKGVIVGWAGGSTNLFAFIGTPQ